MGRLMSILTLQEQRELARLMKRLGKHAMASYANSDKRQRPAPAPTNIRPVSYFLPPNSGNRLPVSLLTGFLGSGKTALVNRLLRFPEMAPHCDPDQ